MAVRAVPAAEKLHGVAWARLSSRRFFLAVAVAASASVVLASLLAAVVAVRNDAAVEDARDQGLRVAGSVTEFRNHLSLADATVGSELVSRERTLAPDRAQYESELLDASNSLTAAGLVASGASTDEIGELAGGLVRYSDLVETSRAYPVGSTFHDLARQKVRAHLVPTARDVRERAEAEVVAATGRVTGPFTTLAVVGLAVALVVLVASVVLVAGRTRIALHPAFVPAVALFAVELLVVSSDLWSQRSEMRAAAATEVDAFVDANDAAFRLFDLRSAETDAVAARGNGTRFFEAFDEGARSLVRRLNEQDGNTADAEALVPTVDAYLAGVDQVSRHDAAGNVDAAAQITLDGDSAVAFRVARGLAVSTVSRSTRHLGDRLEAAEDHSVAWMLPIGLGALAAVFALTGVLHRGWDYL